MFKMDIAGSMIDRAAGRVRVAYLERSRADKMYKQHLKDTKNPKELEGDLVFNRLRSDLEMAKANYINAQSAMEAIKAAPPL